MKTVHNFVKSEASLFATSVRSFLPQDALVPFPSVTHKCTVEKGSVVSEGQIIASAISPENVLASDIHAPIPGTVTDIVTCKLADGTLGSAVKIHLAGAFSYLGRKQEHTAWSTFSSDYLLSELSKKGVVNTFAKVESLAAQIKSRASVKNRFLVVRMFDEDPSRMTDTFIATRMTNQVIEGAAITARALGAIGIIFALPQKALFKLDESVEKILSGIPYCTVTCDTSRYPSGLAQNILQQIKKSIAQENKEPFGNINHRCLFIDPETAVSVYEAIALGIPVVERYVHVTGKDLPSAALFKVRIGTTLGALAKQCGGLTEKEPNIIVNGLIRGSFVKDMNIPVGNFVKSIEFVDRSPKKDQKFAPCIHCGKCRSICPEGIYPDLIYRYCSCGKIEDDALIETIELCSDCGLCNSYCPSRLPLCQAIASLRSQQK